ncbi:MAG: protein kinase [Anaerolineales bacterium]|nr:MAG: protein kinase [Anaerolineales bacterium]
MTAPEKIGRYEIKDELGRGGMATVYRGYDPRFEREVAIKFLPPELVHADPQFKVRFEREAKIIARLEHPAIVPVYDVGEENNQPYFVMRYMGGGSLSERIKANTFSIEEAVRILEQIAPGLDEAHTKDIVHRDLKPGNILFTDKGMPLISDFGIAKFTQAEGGNVTGSAIIGTPAYMSPEQASGDAVDGRTDIYALGVILYEMLTGKQPYQADTPLGVAIKHITEPVPHILEANPNLPEWMEKVIAAAMAKDKDDRFSTAVELVETIKAFLRGEAPPTRKSLTATVKASPFNKTSVAKKKKSSPLPAIIIGGLLLFGLLGGGGYFLFKSMSPVESEAPTPTVTVPASTETSAPVVVSNVTETSVPEIATEEPTATVTEPAASGIPVVGGADKVAFLRNNDIWLMNLDGSDLQQITTDGAAKFNLQWLNDSKTLLFMSGKTVKTVDVETLREENIMSFISAEYFESFRVSPDGSQAAFSINRELFIVPFDVSKLTGITRKSQLLELNGCIFYNELAIKEVRWSDDGQKLAIKYLANADGTRVDTIRIIDIHECDPTKIANLDNFPLGRFQFSNEIVNYDWDGDLLFFFNSNIRNAGFGDLIFYNSFTRKFEKPNLFDRSCCYRDAAFSPDGTHVVFAFQDIRLGTANPIQLYYIPADTLATNRELIPLPLPEGFFNRRNDTPMPALRPVR